MRDARQRDEGVCVSHPNQFGNTLTPPQCECDYVPVSPSPVSAGQPVSPWNNSAVGLAATATSWSTSARLAARNKTKASKSIDELVPRCYHRFLKMFQKSASQGLPPRRRYYFRVDLIPGAQPQASRIIPLSPAENEALDTLINDGLAQGTIRRTTSPWAAPVLFAGKKDGNLRPCFDYRKLNALTVKNKYPLPLTMELVDSLLNADTFTKLDLRNAYGNLRVAEGDEDKLAFVCRAGQFAPLTMPFGPTGAPGYFQYFMQDILLGRIGRDTAAYLDDIMIYTKKGVDHEEAVRSVLETLSKHTLWLKPEKCEFFRSEVEYLGLLISCNRLRMDPTKVKAVSDWPAPRNLTELQRFIGFANFYRRFIDHFSRITRPLHELTKKDVAFEWNANCQTAFDHLKTAFTSAPILKIADPYQPFILECDCSDFALGAVLSQVCSEDGLLHPVAYLSRSLIKAERDYTIFDKELLAIIASFKEWRHYLEGNPNRLHAIVYTDHRNLESFMTTKQLTRRQARWAEILGCFDFDIVFRPSEDASRPDALSRRPDLKFDEKDRLSFGQLLRPENLRPDTFSAIAAFDSFFEEETIDLDDADSWFSIDVLNVDPIATAESVSSCPTKPSLLDLTTRDARQLDEGVCEAHPTQFGPTLAPPQCECDSFPANLSPVSAGKPSPLLDIWTDAQLIEEI